METGFKGQRSSKWANRLRAELAYREEFEGLSKETWKVLLRRERITSSNHDTVLSLDFPHYCIGATSGCGGPRGWCYTFQGPLAGKGHHRRVALVDQASKECPDTLAEAIDEEVTTAVREGLISYPNLRFSGSGEAAEHHIALLGNLSTRGIKVWGFSRNLSVAKMLRKQGVFVQISTDRTTPRDFVAKALEAGFSLAYSSTDVSDLPFDGTRVVFPLHRSGHVREVVDTPNLCPKVVEEFFQQARRPGYCQALCHKCHGRK